MKIPCCSVCQTRYNDQDRCPLLLQCGHSFCRDCLSKMFSAAAADTTLPCPRCRHVTLVGNSVQALKKNYAILALILSSSTSSSVDLTDEDNEPEEDGEGEERRRRRSRSEASSSSGCGAVIELGLHGELKLVRRIGEGRRAGVEMWAAVVSGGGKGGRRRCKHRVAVKKLAEAAVGEGTDLVWVQGQLEELRKASMWCRNVCAFHGVRKVERCLAIVMDMCNGSVQTEMQRNEGRLTLEQILRFCVVLISSIGS